MNIFRFIIFSLFIAFIHGDFQIIQQIPTTNIYPSTRQLSIEINQTVNQPSFSANIYIYNATSNTTIYLLDVSLNTSNVTYSNNTLTFPIPGFNISDQIYITFDAGVLFSNSSVNSTAETNRQFWYLTVIADVTTTSATTTVGNPSTETTYGGTTGSSMIYSVTSTMLITTVVSTYSSLSQTTQNLTTSTISNTTQQINNGESPPTRSAQIGMGLGITFITILIIVEIIYFKFCYSGNGRSGSYFT